MCNECILLSSCVSIFYTTIILGNNKNDDDFFDEEKKIPVKIYSRRIKNTSYTRTIIISNNN